MTLFLNRFIYILNKYPLEQRQKINTIIAETLTLILLDYRESIKLLDELYKNPLLKANFDHSYQQLYDNLKSFQGYYIINEGIFRPILKGTHNSYKDELSDMLETLEMWGFTEEMEL